MAKKQIVKALEKGASDKRTLSSTKAAARALASEFKPSQIAAKLGISTQKWTAVKSKIQKGKLFNPDLRDLLRKVESKLSGRKVERKETKQERAARLDLGLSKKEFKEQNKKIKKQIRREDSRIGIEKRGDVYFYKNHDDLIKKVKHAKTVKRLPDYKQAKEWWKEIGGGSAYFVITKKGNLFNVVDIRTNKERSKSQKGKLNGVARARQIIENQFNDLHPSDVEELESDEESEE